MIKEIIHHHAYGMVENFCSSAMQEWCILHAVQTHIIYTHAYIAISCNLCDCLLVYHYTLIVRSRKLRFASNRYLVNVHVFLIICAEQIANHKVYRHSSGK